jgi:uncharacterized protein with HEPN domain
VKDDRLYLGHILEAVEPFLAYSAEGEAAFRRDVKTQDAIIRNLQVMGEAVKKVSTELREAHAEIPWKDIAGMRHRVVHDYFGISLDIVWDVVTHHVHRSARSFTSFSARERAISAAVQVFSGLSVPYEPRSPLGELLGGREIFCPPLFRA